MMSYLFFLHTTPFLSLQNGSKTLSDESKLSPDHTLATILPSSLMMRFDLRLFNSSQTHPGDLKSLLYGHKGWFTNPSYTGHKIHPLFRKEMFSDVEFYEDWKSPLDDHPITDAFYDSLRPSLLLASAMLKRSRDFWVLILKAPIIGGPSPEMKYYQEDYLSQNLRHS